MLATVSARVATPAIVTRRQSMVSLPVTEAVASRVKASRFIAASRVAVRPLTMPVTT